MKRNLSFLGTFLIGFGLGGLASITVLTGGVYFRNRFKKICKFCDNSYYISCCRDNSKSETINDCH